MIEEAFERFLDRLSHSRSSPAQAAEPDGLAEDDIWLVWSRRCGVAHPGDEAADSLS